MLIRPKASNVNALSPLQFWMLVGVSCVALIVVAATFTPRQVQADALLPRPAATAPPPAASATPVMNQIGEESTKHGKTFRGLASWYGAVFNGRHTASGERFDMYAMTACHPTLPFGSKVRVVNLANKRSVVVRITDRGDLEEGRVIDLSYGAAEKLEMTKAGVVHVSLEVLSLGSQNK
jgi:rare lipoprotein A